MSKNSTIIITLLLLTLIISITLVVTKNEENNLGESDKIVNIEKVKKPQFEKKKILKGKQLTQQEWNNKKTEKVNQLKQYFADTRDSELLGASNNEIKSLDVKDKSYNEFMDDMNEWFEIAQGENCFKNLDPEGEGILTWDLVESINNKLENNEC